MARSIMGLAALAWLFVPGQVCAAIVLVDQSVIQAGGFGNELNILTLQDDGDGQQWGSVSWSGSQDLYVNAKSGGTGDVSKVATKTATRSIQDLKDAGIAKDAFALLSDINEDDTLKELRLRDFSLLFLDPDGSLNFKLTYDAADGGELFANTGGGAGSSDWLFQVVFENDAQRSFFDNINAGRVGMEILQSNAMTEIGDGAETFSAARYSYFEEPSTGVPEPTSLVTWCLLGAVGIAVGWSRRRPAA